MNTKHGLSKTPEYHRMMASKRKEKKRLLDYRWTPELNKAFWSFFGDCGCVVCGSRNDLTIDHIKPLSQGNGLSADNAVLLCRSCNSSKKTKRIEELPIESQNKIQDASAAFWEYCANKCILPNAVNVTL